MAFSLLSDNAPRTSGAVFYVASDLPVVPDYHLQAGIQIGRAELLDDTMVKVLNKVNNTRHPEASTLLFELTVRTAKEV